MVDIVPKNIVYLLAIKTTDILNTKQDELCAITWTEGEYNLDTQFSKLCCTVCEQAWTIVQSEYPEYSGVSIKCTDPDIKITFISPLGKMFKTKIELKSSKSLKMPGSTIKNLDINQPLIYCYRPTDKSRKYIIRCSQYYVAMGASEHDLFQDRSPRPWLNFNNMSKNVPFVEKEKDEWITHYAQCSLNRLNCDNIQYSWQDTLVRKIRESVISAFIKDTSVEEFMKLKSQS